MEDGVRLVGGVVHHHLVANLASLDLGLLLLAVQEIHGAMEAAEDGEVHLVLVVSLASLDQNLLHQVVQLTGAMEVGALAEGGEAHLVQARVVKVALSRHQAALTGAMEVGVPAEDGEVQAQARVVNLDLALVANLANQDLHLVVREMIGMEAGASLAGGVPPLQAHPSRANPRVPNQNQARVLHQAMIGVTAGIGTETGEGTLLFCFSL